jgi:N-glycosylase/DNA lyase
VSARRRRRRKARTPLERATRQRKRRGLACRAYHWRQLRASLTFQEWRRPVDHDVRIAYFVARCPVCRPRVYAQAAAVITIDDELSATGTAQIEAIARARAEAAKAIVLGMVTPRRCR